MTIIQKNLDKWAKSLYFCDLLQETNLIEISMRKLFVMILNLNKNLKQ